MRKGNMELGKKIITWAMAAVMTVTSVGGSFGTMTVYAEENVSVETTTEKSTSPEGSTTTETTTTTTTTTSTETVTFTPESNNVTVSKSVNDGGTEYYVDGTKVADEVTADAQGEQDHIVEELVIDESATQINHYIVDAEGKYVTDKEGNNIEVTDGTVIEQIDVVEKTNHTLEKVNEEDIVFVKTNEDGVRELVDADTEDAEEYVKVDNAEDYADSVTINELTVKDAEGKETKQFVDDDLAALLVDDNTTKSGNYTRETVYTVTVIENGEETTKSIKKSDVKADNYSGNFEVDEETEELTIPVESKPSYIVTDTNGNDYEVESNSALTVTKQQGLRGESYYTVTIGENKVTVDKNSVTATYSFTVGENTYDVDNVITSNNGQKRIKIDMVETKYYFNGEEVDYNKVKFNGGKPYIWNGNGKKWLETETSYYINVNDQKVQVSNVSKSQMGYNYIVADTNFILNPTQGETTYWIDNPEDATKKCQVSSENVIPVTRYDVYKDGVQLEGFSFTPEEYDAIKVESKDYAKVEDEYVVYSDNDKDGKKEEVARFTEDEWKVITEAKVTYKKVTKMYYTTDANVEYITTSFGEKGNELKLGNTYYKLDVKLFKNTDGITYEVPTCTIDTATNEAVVSVAYTLEDGKTGTFVRRVALAGFGESNYATVTIKYVPTFTTKAGFKFDVAVTKTTKDTVVVETVKTTTTDTQEIEQNTGTSVDTAIKANNGNPINEVGDNKNKANHVDVRVNVNISQELEDKGVENASVAEAIIKIDHNGKTYSLGEDDIRRDGWAYEFTLDKHSEGRGNDGFQGNKTITIYAKIVYKLNGVDKELWYATTVYPEVYDDLNVCPAKYWNGNSNQGFDFVISVDKVNEAITQQITTTTTTTNTTQSTKMTLGKEEYLTPDEVAEVVKASVNEEPLDVDKNLIKALMFVRLDGMEVEENGTTHYPTTEYSKELANGQVILLYSPYGYKVFGEVGDEKVSGHILDWVEDGSESNIAAIETAYIEGLTEGQKNSIQDAVKVKVDEQIEAKKKAIAEELFGENYTDEQFNSVTWDIDQEKIDNAIADVMANLNIRWYVLKDEADGAHIDGVIVTKSFDIEVNGEVITIPEIIPDEPAPVPPTDEGSDGGSTGGGSSSRSSRSSSDEGAVLGAKREQEGLVPEEGQVLGAVRAPKTSDASKAILWMLVMGGSALGAAAVLAQKKKEEA